IRYFGVNSDEGFSLTINGALVGAYPDIRTAATTDVTNTTVGTMSCDFPTAGRYYLVLDFFENSGGEEIEFFQTDATGGNRRLINVDSELQVYRDDVAKVDATNVVVTDSSMLTCQVDLTGEPCALWNIIIKPDCGQANRALLEEALLVNNGGDFNGDGLFDIADLKELADRWGDVCSAPEWCDCGDLDFSERIGLGDFAILAERWAQNE
ncbi:MAG: hypothetical protein J7M40_01495, partial [Planctomycetes bacterium]|nr:hypothetical protein [Planctomycetota bacterium]